MKYSLRNSVSGVVLPSVLVLILCGCVLVSMLAVHAGRSMLLTRRTLDYQRASVLAESGLGYGLMSVKYKMAELGWKQFSARYGAGNIERLDTETLPDYDGEYKNGVYFTVNRNNTNSSTIEDGLMAITITSISKNRRSGIASAVREDVEIEFARLGQYAAFYTRDLEVWPGENMTFIGKVHTNGDLYLGADKLLKFDRNVTASGKFYAQRKPNSGYGDAAYVTATERVKFLRGDDEHIKYSDYADVINGKTRMDSSLGNLWASSADNYYKGAVKTGQQKIAPPISVNDDEHTIIERSAVWEPKIKSPNSDTEAVKFANKAALTIRVTKDNELVLYDYKKREIATTMPLMCPAKSVSKANDDTGRYNVQQGEYRYTDEAGVQQTTGNLPAYQVSNYIYDRREDCAMAPVDIYIDEILRNPTLMSYLYPDGLDNSDLAEGGVLYITRDGDSVFDGTENEGMAAYDYLTEKVVKTGRFNETTSTDTKTTTDQRQKDNYVRQGYTVVSQKTSGWTTTYTLQKTTTTRTEITETVVATNKIPVQPCVRIRNASNLSIAGIDEKGEKRGLSIATDLPMYVEGAFNTDGTKGRAKDDCKTLPSALVAADAVTMLSTAWKDEWRTPNWKGWKEGAGKESVRPTENLDTRKAVETTFNGILMTGIVESNNGTYSGGLQNLFRFLENWRLNGTLPYNFNGSMVCMWTSNIARNPIEGTYTYQPPSRPWGWAEMNPPGLPNLMNFRESNWRRIDPADYGDDAF